MTKNKKILLVVALLIVVITVLCYTVFRNNTNQPTTSGKLVTGLPEETFSGKITAVDTGCFYDAICSVTVDGKKVIVMTGRMIGEPQPVGRLIGVESIGDLEGKIGTHVNVYAATTTTPGEWTLYGDEKYYVEVVGVIK